jgi:hypothetical protein
VRRALGWLAAFATLALAALPAHAAQLAYVPAATPAAYVAIEPIARKLGWTFRRTADGAVLDDGTGPQALRIGSRSVREDDSDVPLLDNPVLVRNGNVALTLADAATLFHLDVEQDGPNVALVSASGADAMLREVPRPATPPPAPAATAKPTTYTPPAVVAGNAGTLALSVTFDGSNRIYQTSLAGNAGLVRGNVSTYGNDAVTAPVGLVTVGAPVENVSFGSVDDPLAGSVIQNGTMAGLDLHFAQAGTSYDAATGHTYDGSIVALARTHGGTSDTLADVSSLGVDQAIFRHAVVDTERWGTLDDELLIGAKGTAAGIHARTRGKTFLDAVATDAHGTLPLNDGDEPLGAVVGEHLSSTTTVTAGYVRSIAAPGSPTLGATTRLGGVALGANVSEHWTNLSASVGGSAGYAALFASAGAPHVYGFDGGFNLDRGKALAELDLNGSGGTTSGIAQLRTNHAGLNLAAGLDLDTGVARPLIGVVVPIQSALAFEAGLVPGPSGRPDLKLALLAGFRAPRPRVATFPLTVFVPDAAHYGPLQLFIDGARVTLPVGPQAHVQLPAGRHTVYVESADQAYGSLPADVVVAGSGAAPVALPLLPQREIAGHVRFGGPADAVPMGESLQGIRVVLEPSGESAMTDADGHYVFPRAPYDPASTILLDPASVPGGFAAPPALPLGAGDTDVTLTPQRSVEQVSIR